MKIYWHHDGHITKMAAMSLYGKNPSKVFFRNQLTDFHETWYVALLTPAYHSLLKCWPWVDLDLFYGKVKFGNIGLSIGKSENCRFFRTFAACDLKPITIMKICEYWRSRSFLDLAQGHLHLKTKSGFSQKWLGHFEPNFVLGPNIRWAFHRTIGPLVKFFHSIPPIAIFSARR